MQIFLLSKHPFTLTSSFLLTNFSIYMEFKYHGIHFNNGGSKIADASSSFVLINDDIMKSLLLLSKIETYIK